MLSSSLLGVALLAAGSMAQTQTTSNKASQSSADAAAATYTIAVGAEGFKFTPAETKDVPVGSILEFRIYPGGHAVARSDFKQPCIPYALTGANHVGFYSGMISPQVITDNLPKYSVRVNDTNPIFIYCTAPTSCIKEHMVGVINPSVNQTLDIQMQFAENATLQLTPGENFPQEGATTTAGAGPTATSVPGNNNNNGGGGTHLSAGAIAGIAIGGAVVFLIAGLMVYLCGRRGGLDRAYRNSAAAFSGQQQQPPMGETYNPSLVGPKSPGQATFTTNHYSMGPDHDPYRNMAQSPPYSYTPGVTPPPMSPQYSVYDPYRNSVVGAHSPLMGELHSQPISAQDKVAQTHIAPVELPTLHETGQHPAATNQEPHVPGHDDQGAHKAGGGR